jgi:hypothetical protein
LKAWQQRRTAGKQVLLNATGLILLVAYVLNLAALVFDSLCVVHCDRDVTGEGLEKFDLRLGEGVSLMVRSAEDSDYAIAHLQRNNNLRSSMGFAGSVVQFLGDIGGVVRPSCDYHLARQTFGYRPTLTLAGLSATMHGGEMELVTVYQQNAGLDAAKVHGNPVDYRVEEFVELKNGADLLRCLLNRKQNIYSALLENRRARDGSRMTGSGWHGSNLDPPSLDS